MLIYYQDKLNRLTKNTDSALNSFKKFFEHGASQEEAKILDCMREVLESYFKDLSCISKPEDYKKLFEGNSDDCFRLGVRVSRKSAKLFASFYKADMIIASPLGLKLGQVHSDF